MLANASTIQLKKLIYDKVALTGNYVAKVIIFKTICYLKKYLR